MLLALARRCGYRPHNADWVAGVVLGALFFLAGHGFLHWAELHIASGLAGVGQSLLSSVIRDTIRVRSFRT